MIFTQDADFLDEAQKRQQQGLFFTGVIYAHQLNISSGQCVKELELIAKVYEPEDTANRVEYLPLGCRYQCPLSGFGAAGATVD